MKLLSRIILKLMGWKIIGSLPTINKYVLIVVPHTSNWDLIIGLLGRFAVGVKLNFLAKHQIFFFPLGSLMRALGGYPVNRTKSGNTVAHVVNLFKERDALKLAIAPEGTRSRVVRWKEGFYHIATQAGVPIVMVGFDYPSKEIRIQLPFVPTGDMAEDFPMMIDFFRTIKGRYPKEIPDYNR